MKKININDIILRAKVNDAVITRGEVSVTIRKNTHWCISAHHSNVFTVTRDNVSLALTKAEVETMFNVISASPYQAGHPSEIKKILDKLGLQMTVHVMPVHLKNYHS